MTLRKWPFSIMVKTHFHFHDESFPFRDENEMTFPGQPEEMTFRKSLFSIMVKTHFHFHDEFFPLHDENEMTFPGQPEEMTFSKMTYFHHGQNSFPLPWWKCILHKKVISIMEMKMSFSQRKSFPFRWWKWVLAAWKWLLGQWKWLLGYENELRPSDFHFHWLKSHFGDENEFRNSVSISISMMKMSFAEKMTFS